MILQKMLVIGAVVWPLFFAVGTARTCAQTPKLSPSAKIELSEQPSEAVKRGDAAGVVEAVVNREGPIYVGAAGKLNVAQNKPMTMDAIFVIASMTKPVTSVVVMKLIEQGKLNLEDPISRYLPGFENLRVITKFNETDGTYETRPAARPITIRHLLTHTSGIAYAFSNPIEARLATGTKKDPWEFPLLNDPGDKWNYSPGTRLLGRVVEKITSLSLEEYFQRNIFEPLGMVDTSFAVPLAKRSRVASWHRRTDGLLKEYQRSTIPSVPTPPFYGDGGLYSTAEDYGRFIQMFLNAGHVRSDARSARIVSENR